MAPNVTVSFWAPDDINGTPLLTITDEDAYFKGLKLKPDLYGLGGWELTLARNINFALFGSGAIDPEVFVRFLVHAWSDTDWFYGGQLNKRQQTVIDRDEAGAEEFILGGPGPKQYMERYRLGTLQLSGAGSWLVDLTNGVWRWNETATAGRVLNRLVAEDAAAANPALPDLTSSFDQSNDSDGVAWADDIATGDDFELPIGNSLLQTIWDLEDLADLTTTVYLGTVSDPQYRLDAVQSYGQDVTGSAEGSGVCRLAEGVNIANDSLEVQGVSLKKATHVIIEGKDGVWATTRKLSWSSGDYVKWEKIEYTRSNSAVILEKAGLRWLQRQDNGDQAITVEIVPGDDEAAGFYFPGPDQVLWLGNLVTLDSTADGSTHSPLDYNNSVQLVTGLELSLGPAGDETTADKAAKSWDLKVLLNHERGGNSGSPNQSSAATGSGGCSCAPLCHINVEGTPPSETLTPLYRWNANGDGGDALGWEGILANQGSGSPGGGAAGSTHYYFKSSAPEQWADLLAVSAGTVLRFTGYLALSSGETLKVGFFSSGTIGDPGNSVVLIGTATVLGTGPKAQWTFFSQDVEAPVGTTRFALGRVGGPAFDQITVDTVETDPGTGGVEGDCPADVGLECASGEAGRAARCDHVHAHGNLSDDGLHHHNSDDIEGGGGGVTFGTPAIVLGTAAAAGSIAEAIRRDSTIVAFDATAPVTQAFGDSAATGSAAVAARRDHKHGMPSSGGSGAPDTADYLVGTAQAGLSAEIVVGTTPGGELGGTWASPTVDATHSGSAHHAEDHDHDGSPTQKLLQANSHQSPDTDSASSSLHHTLGSSGTQAAAGNHTHGGVETIAQYIPIVGPWVLTPNGVDTGNFGASSAMLIPYLIPGPMKLRHAAFRMTAAGTGTYEWGLFDCSASATACTKVAGGSGTLNGTGWLTIAATGAPVSLTPGLYYFILKMPATNLATFARYDAAVAAGNNKLYPSASVYVWDDTPDITSATWIDTRPMPQMYLRGDINGSGTQW